MHVCVCMCVCVGACMCVVCMRVCACVESETQKDNFSSSYWSANAFV